MSELEELPSWAGRAGQTDDDRPEGQPILGEPTGDALPKPPAAAETVRQDAPSAPVLPEPGKPAIDDEAPKKSKKDRRQQRADESATTRAANETADGHMTYAQPVPPRRGRGLVVGLVLLGILALVGMGALGYFLAQAQGSDAETATDGAAATDDGAAVDSTIGDDAATTDAAGDDSATADGALTAAGDATEADDDAAMADGEADDGTATDGSATDSATGDAAGGDDTVTVDVDAGDGGDAAPAGDDAPTGASEYHDSGRQAVLRGGKVYLSGAVPSKEIGELIEQKAAAVIGPDNVVNEYTIDPTAEIKPGESAPIYVEDVVLFQFNSVEVDEPFLPILDLGTALMRQNPQATITVVSRTDAVGSEAMNQQVAQLRGQAVINYWLTQGVDRSQMKIDARGEEGASESDDDETAAKNRRAEFIVTGLLD